MIHIHPVAFIAIVLGLICFGFLRGVVYARKKLKGPSKILWEAEMWCKYKMKKHLKGDEDHEYCRSILESTQRLQRAHSAGAYEDELYARLAWSWRQLPENEKESLMQIQRQLAADW